MKPRWTKLFVVAVFLIVPALAVAGETRTVTAAELVALVKPGEKVKLVLKSGTYGEGRLEAVEAEGLKVNIQKSHNLNDLPQGLQAIAFERLASVTVSRLKGKKRVWLPVTLTSTLGALALVVAVGGDLEERTSRYTPAALALTGGLAVGGYYGGRPLDRKSLTFAIK